MLTIDGLITGIDTETIINGLLEIQQTQIDRLQLRRREIQAKQAAYDSLETQLVSFRSTADQLARPQANLFHSRTVTVSQSSSLFATARTNAALGTYTLHIDALARAHQIASNGFADADAEITQGTIDLANGSADPVPITIDETNNTLAGLAAAINAADAGVAAAVINDGSSGGTPFRLLLTSDDTGIANEITLNNLLAADNGSAIQPTFDFGNPVQAASDAQVRLGTGPGALTVNSADNTIDDLIQGVTLDLLSADAGQEIQLRISNDTEPAKAAITDLVDTYNSINDFIDQLVRYNADTDEAGLLIGDRTVTDIQNEIRTAMLDVVPGLGTGTTANRLTVLGITVNNTGRLTVNETRLEEVLAGRVEGIQEDDLERLFGFPGTPGPELLQSQGVAKRISQFIQNLIDIESGELTTAKDGFGDQLLSIDQSIERQQALFTAQQDDLVAQFAALESGISQLQSTSSFLSNQLASLGSLTRRS